MNIKKIVTFLVLSICFTLFADYSLDSNIDCKNDIWVEEFSNNGVIISRNSDDAKITKLEETDLNLDGIMDNFYYFEDGYVVRQEVDSNYDQKIDVWVHIINDGKFITKYEKDTDYDGLVDKIKEFEVYK